MSIDIEVGFEEITKTTQELVLLEVTLQRDVPILVLRRIGQRVLQLAKEIVPVRTGALRDSITMKEDGDGIVIGSDLEYSIYVELGTSKMAAQPYIIPSLFQAINELEQEFPEFLQGIIER